MIRVSDRDFWRDEITRVIKDKIEDIIAKENPTILTEAEKEARQEAIVSLGIKEYEDRCAELNKQLEEIVREALKIRRKEEAIVRGIPEEAVDLDAPYGGYYRRDYGAIPDLRQEVKSAIEKRARISVIEILGRTDTGRKILKLRKELENVTRIVMLATSVTQLKQLWANVVVDLGLEQGNIEQAAARLEPMELSEGLK